jgi:hypothetical protein
VRKYPPFGAAVAVLVLGCRGVPNRPICACWSYARRAINAPHLVAFVRTGARFECGRLIERG